MTQSNLRKTTATGMLALCLVLILAGSAQARVLELPGHPDQAQIGLEEEASFWHKLWRRIESLWARSSVLIIPEGSSVLIIPEG